jgi:NitT/TauT family transport system ATP-binding protein
MDTAVGLRPCLIDVKNCRQAYYKEANADLVVLDDVNLTLHEGEIVALLGRSGSGKSTLLRIVSGLLKPTSGSVKWRGAAVTGPTEGVAMVFQSFALFPWLTVQESSRRQPVRAGTPVRIRDRSDRPGRVRERLSEGVVGRHASACRAGPGAGGASRPAADG